jgi:glycosyltransferase involved in cell wall biosynthesis
MKILVVNWQDIRNPNAGGAEVHLHEVFSRIARAGHEVTLYCSSYPGAAQEETVDGIHVIREGGRYLFNFRPLRAYMQRFRRAGFDVIVDDLNKLAVSLYCRKRVPFIVGSPSTKTELLQRGCRGDIVHVINYAVDHKTHRKTDVPKSAAPLIGYFGRLKRYKSVHHLLEALPKVAAQVPDLRVLIVGEGDDRPRLEALAREKGLSHMVEFTGFVPEERKMELLQRMWCKIMTSSKEGWGLTVLEANACGTTVIASNVPGLKDAVRDGETGLLYSYGNTEELARHIALVLKDGALRERLSGEAVAWSHSFTWDRAAAETLAVLQKQVLTR